MCVCVCMRECVCMLECVVCVGSQIFLRYFIEEEKKTNEREQIARITQASAEWATAVHSVHLHKI